MDLQKKPRAKQAVLMTCIAVLCATLAVVCLLAGGISLFIGSQNDKNMKLSFWDSTFTVETAFSDPKGNVSIILNEVTRKGDLTPDDVINLNALLPVRDMPLTVQSGDKTYTYAELLQNVECALTDGHIVTNYVLYVPAAADDMTLTINGKSVNLTLTKAENIKPAVISVDTPVGPFTMSTYYLGGNYSAVWCEMDTDLTLTALGICDVNVKYTSKTTYRDIDVDLPVSDNCSLKLIGLMSNKPGYQKDTKVVTNFNFEDIYYETEVDISGVVGSVQEDKMIGADVLLDETIGLKVNSLARRSKQVLCYLSSDTNYGTLSGGSGYVMSAAGTPTDAQLKNRAGTTADAAVFTGSSADRTDSLKLHIASLRFTVEKLSTSVPFAEAK